MKCQTPMAIEFNRSDTQRKPWLVGLMNNNSLLSERDEKTHDTQEIFK